MYYTTHVGKPTAHITKRKSRLKVYNGNKIFLENGDNFEFEVHNPKQKSVLVKIKLNGEYISQSGIVIKPGQRVFLERFLDSNNKFEFTTYDVEDTPLNKSAIDLNGDVLVEFYDEEYSTNFQNLSVGNSTSGWTTINTGTPYWGGGTYTTNVMSTPTFTTSSSNSSVFYSQTTPQGPNIRSLKSKKSIETGRVEKGGLSNQSFSNSYQNFNLFTSHTVSYKILPFGTKNKSVDEIRQYCTECGVKVKKNFKFCPSCGNKI